MMQNLMENPNPRSEFLKNESFAGVSSIWPGSSIKKILMVFIKSKDRLQSFVAGSKEVLGRGVVLTYLMIAPIVCVKISAF